MYDHLIGNFLAKRQKFGVEVQISAVEHDAHLLRMSRMVSDRIRTSSLSAH